MALDEGNGTGQPEPNRRRGLGERLSTAQSSFSRLVATGGIIGIGTGIAAIMGTQDVADWIVGIVVSSVSLILAAVAWSTRNR
ncbi:MAG TPA: hypothetical protein VH281_04820 [Gaiellaceae bacterium]|jgi:hypothetical protein